MAGNAIVRIEELKSSTYSAYHSPLPTHACTMRSWP